MLCDIYFIIIIIIGVLLSATFAIRQVGRCLKKSANPLSSATAVRQKNPKKTIDLSTHDSDTLTHKIQTHTHTHTHTHAHTPQSNYNMDNWLVAARSAEGVRELSPPNRFCYWLQGISFYGNLLICSCAKKNPFFQISLEWCRSGQWLTTTYSRMATGCVPLLEIKPSTLRRRVKQTALLD